MATGIPFLDGLISGVNNAVTTVQTAVNNAQHYITTTTQQAQNQLGSFVSSVGNTISGITTAVQNQVVPNSSTYTQTYYNPPTQSVVQSVPQPQQYSIPVALQGSTFAPTVYNPYSNQNVQYQQQPSTVNLQGFDFNTVYSAVNAAFAALPSIVNAIQNPLNNPYTSALIQQLNNLYNQQQSTVNLVAQLVQDVEKKLYQSTSTALNNVGIDVGNWGNVLDATVRKVMEGLGYDFNQRINAVADMMENGQRELADSIQQTQIGLSKFINFVQQDLFGQQDIIKRIANSGLIAETTPPSDFITIAVDKAGMELQRVLSETLDYGMNNPASFFQQLGNRINDISGVIDDLKAGKFTSSEQFFSALFGNEPSTGLARGLIILASVIPTLISAVNMAGEPALNSFQQLINADSPVKLLSPSDYLTAYFKKQISYEYLEDKLKKQGISEEQLHVLLTAALIDPDMSSMIDARRRGILKDEEWKDYLTDQRLDSRSIEIIDELLHILPGPNDLTRIADKRIWGLNLPEKYGQYSELPQQYLDYMAKSGYDEQFTKWFWASHWELPSPNQIFEMFQRHVITQEDMQAYLALTDWLPFFRDKLLAISYNPLTRVDIRRMYALGMFTDTELVTRYEAIGFSPNDAALMAEFTRRFSADDGDSEIDKLKTKIGTAVQSLYVRGKLDYNEAVERLVTLGKDRNIAQLSLNLLNLEKSIDSTPVSLPDYKNKAIKIIKDAYLQGTYPRSEAEQNLLDLGLSQYEAEQELHYLDLEKAVKAKQDNILMYETRLLNGVDTEAQFIAALSFAGLNNGEINAELNEVKNKAAKKFKMPTEKQVQTWYNAGNITADFVVSYLQFLGYPQDLIPMILLGDYGIEV